MTAIPVRVPGRPTLSARSISDEVTIRIAFPLVRADSRLVCVRHGEDPEGADRSARPSTVTTR
jgi:hypothetical protein